MQLLTPGAEHAAAVAGKLAPPVPADPSRATPPSKGRGSHRNSLRRGTAAFSEPRRKSTIFSPGPPDEPPPWADEPRPPFASWRVFGPSPEPPDEELGPAPVVLTPRALALANALEQSVGRAGRAEA